MRWPGSARSPRAFGPLTAPSLRAQGSRRLVARAPATRQPAQAKAASAAQKASQPGLLGRAVSAAQSLFQTQSQPTTETLADAPAADPLDADEAEEAEDEAQLGAQGPGVKAEEPQRAAGPKKAAQKRMRLNDKGAAAGTELDKNLAEWVRCSAVVLRCQRRADAACACAPAPLRLRARAQIDKGLGAGPDDAVEKWYKDPLLSKGKTPGEAAHGKLFCDKLYEMGITPVASTWQTVGARIEFLVAEALRWEAAFGALDKIPTGGAKTTRVVHNVETGEDEVVDWPWEDWMWPMIRLGRQRKGAAATAAVKKEDASNAQQILRAQQQVAQLVAAALAAPNAEKAAAQAKVDEARARLANLLGAKAAKGLAPKDVADDMDVEDDNGEGQADADTAPAPAAGRVSSGVDSGVAALLKKADESEAMMKRLWDEMTTESVRAREHAAQEAEKQREHDARMQKERAEQQKELLLSLAQALRSPPAA